MSDKYFTINIRAYLDKDEPTYIGEESLYDLLSAFSCPKNPDVEYFLLHNAIEFTKKDQSITYPWNVFLNSTDKFCFLLQISRNCCILFNK